MMRGRLILEQLFPGLQDQLIAAGAHVVDMAGEVAWLTPAGWGVNFASDLKMLTFTRGFLDWHVRSRLLKACAGVRVLENWEVTRLLCSDTSAVAGAVVRRRGTSGADRASEQMLFGDLVVDASGRASHAPQWMQMLGYEPPQETFVSAFLGYASRLYQMPAGFKSDWKGAYIQAAPPERTRGAVMFPVEGDRWLLTLCGGGRDYPPTDEAGFLDFARSLPSPLVYEAIKDAVPLSPVHSFRATENRLRHYERLTRRPENFLVMGDAACAFNPVYGQGMTVAAIGALTLDEALREHKEHHSPDNSFKELASLFQKKLAEANTVPWMMATGEDYRYRETVGGPPTLMTRLTHRYMDGVVRLSTKDTGVRRVLLEAFHLMRPPTALFHPAIICKVGGQAISGALARVTRSSSSTRALSNAPLRQILSGDTR